jgi:hypothetical protein
VLQEDENKRATNLGERVKTGSITVAEYRRALGMLVLPEHEIYLRDKNIIVTPAGLSPEEQQKQTVVQQAAAILSRSN